MASEYIIHHPVRVLFSLWPKKLVATYLSDADGIYYSLEMVGNRSGQFGVVYLGFRILAEVYYLAIWAIFLLALPSILHSRLTGYRVGLYVTLYFSLIYMIYFGKARYHFAVMPSIIIYAGVGAERLLKKGWPGAIKTAEIDFAVT